MMNSQTVESLHIPEDILTTQVLSPEQRHQIFDFIRFLSQQQKSATPQQPSEVATNQRKPHPDLAGKMKILGNIIDTIPETEWNLP
ncbi:MAG: hypothetical protein LH474_13170 [Chamaesiphon sp.]|nr:hypothetical protein [Chamaesiphon sp.]